MSGWKIYTSIGSSFSSYPFHITADQMKGPANIMAVQISAAARAFMLNRIQLPSESATIRPNIVRLHAHTQREPPRAPVYSYHCTDSMLRAKEFPSTSQGHDMSASKYALSQAIHSVIRNIYGSTPLKCLLLSRNTPNIRDI